MGDEHPQTLLAASNTALCLKKLEQYAESESLFKSNIEIQRRVLGAEHPKLHKSIYELATLYFIQDQFAQASPWMKEYVTNAWDQDACCIYIRCLLQVDKAIAREAANELRVRADQELKDQPHQRGVFLGNIARELYEANEYSTAQPLLEQAKQLFLQTQDRTSDDASDVDTMLELIKDPK